MEFYDRIKERCTQLGTTPTALSLKLGLARSFLSDYKSGRKKDISAESALLIAQELNTSVEWLITGEAKQGMVLTAEETRLIHAWRSARQEEKENVAYMLRAHGMECDREEQSINAAVS